MAKPRDKLPSLRKSAGTAAARSGAVPVPEKADATPEALARWCARASFEKKAEDVQILDLRDVSAVCDFFVLITGTSEAHVWSLAEWVRTRLLDVHGVGPWHVEGAAGRRWILLDYVHWVVHVFHRETREYYQLERLWGDAPGETLKP